MAELSDQELKKYCEEKIGIFFCEMVPEDQSKMVQCLIAIIRSYISHTKFATQLKKKIESSKELQSYMKIRATMSPESHTRDKLEELMAKTIDDIKKTAVFDLQMYVPDFSVELRLHKREVGKKYRRFLADFEDTGVQHVVFTYLFATIRSLSIKPKKDGFFASYANMFEMVFREILDQTNPKGYFVDGKQLQNEYNKIVRKIKTKVHSVNELPDFNVVANRAKLKRIPRN